MALLNSELVLIRPKINDRVELLTLMANKLVQSGLASPGFTEALLTREAQYPTGLPTDNVKFAIPHADAGYVRQNAISLALLDTPVIFQRMDDPAQEIYVNIVIMLAINDSATQLDTLSRLMSLFGNESLWSEMATLSDPVEVVSMFNATLLNSEGGGR